MEHNDFVPVFEQLESLYLDVDNSIKDKHQARYKNLKERFVSIYGKEPEFYCRAPGRVAIIGEHVDYCGYPVLPAALEQDCVFAVAKNEGSDEIHLHNIDDTVFPADKLSTDPTQPFKGKFFWTNYFLAGYKGILQENSKEVPKPVGLHLLMHSNVPIAAGVSSSSAVTVASALVALAANNLRTKMHRKLIAGNVIRYEQLAGYMCGSMDQTLSLYAEKYTAKLIDFEPEIKTTTVAIPKGVSFVIANSLTPFPKNSTMNTHFNKRVVECRLSAVLLALKTGVYEKAEDCRLMNFHQLHEKLGCSFDEVMELTSKHLKKEGYSNKELAEELKCDPVEVLKDLKDSHEVLEVNDDFKLHHRALNIFGEAKRVHAIRNLCDATDIEEEKRLEMIGDLMRQSFCSNRDFYECSSPELDELISLAMESGAFGSRISGAGWGGCCVSMVRTTELPEFLSKMKKYYTKERENGPKLKNTEEIDKCLFTTQPGQGACVLDPKNCLWI